MTLFKHSKFIHNRYTLRSRFWCCVMYTIHTDYVCSVLPSVLNFSRQIHVKRCCASGVWVPPLFFSPFSCLPASGSNLRGYRCCSGSADMFGGWMLAPIQMLAFTVRLGVQGVQKKIRRCLAGKKHSRARRAQHWPWSSPFCARTLAWRRVFSGSIWAWEKGIIF